MAELQDYRHLWSHPGMSSFYNRYYPSVVLLREERKSCENKTTNYRLFVYILLFHFKIQIKQISWYKYEVFSLQKDKYGSNNFNCKIYWVFTMSSTVQSASHNLAFPFCITCQSCLKGTSCHGLNCFIVSKSMPF